MVQGENCDMRLVYITVKTWEKAVPELGKLTIYTKCMVPMETVSFVFLRVRRGKQDSMENRTKCFVIYLDFPSNSHIAKNAQATTAQLYPARDTFEFGQGHVTNNQPITVLVLLGESLGTV